MAYLNINNMCTFEGRLTADPELSYIAQNGGQQGIAKTKIKVAVDRNMTKQQKEAAQKNNQPTADFIPVEVIGPRAEFVANYFTKGSGIRVMASFKTFSYQKDGQTVYGYNFDAVDVGFTVGGTNGVNNGGGNSNASLPLEETPGFQAIDDSDLPF